MNKKIIIDKVNLNIDTVKNKLTNFILDNGGEIIEKTHNKIVFKSGLFTVFRNKPFKNLLSVIDKGKIEIIENIENIEIKYRLSYNMIIIIGIILIIATFLTKLFFQFTRMEYIVIFVFFTLLTLGNIFVTLIRFKKELKIYLKV